MKTTIEKLISHRLSGGVINKPVYISLCGDLSLDGYWLSTSEDYRVLRDLWVTVCCINSQSNAAINELDKIIVHEPKHLQLWNFQKEHIVTIVNNYERLIQKEMASPEWASYQSAVANELNREVNHASVA